MNIDNHQFGCGDYCPKSGVYYIYKRTEKGLERTEYPRFVQQGNPFPPTPGPGHCFIWDGPSNQSLAA